MRRFPPLAITLVLLGACSGGGGDGVACAQRYWDGSIGTCLPAGWEVLSGDTLSRLGVPDETVAAFQLTEARDGQFDTVTVTSEPLAQDLSSREYAEANILAVSVLPDYDLDDKNDLSIDGEETILHIFQARPVPEKPIRRYYQVSMVKERTGYTFTGSLPLSVPGTAEQAVQVILRNATLEPPAEEE